MPFRRTTLRVFKIHIPSLPHLESSDTCDGRYHGEMTVNGTCALAVHERYLYVSFRTTSQVLRFPLDADGGVLEPLEAEYVAQFSRYNLAKGGGSANIYDLALDSERYCDVSPGYDGAIYRFRPDPQNVRDRWPVMGATATSSLPAADGAQ